MHCHLVHLIYKPSSGLVLMSLRFDASLLLYWQLDTHVIVREYGVCCFGQETWKAALDHKSMPSPFGFPSAKRATVYTQRARSSRLMG